MLSWDGCRARYSGAFFILLTLGIEYPFSSELRPLLFRSKATASLTEVFWAARHVGQAAPAPCFPLAAVQIRVGLENGKT